MARQEAAEGSRARRRMDLNLYVGLPPLSPPRLWLDTSAASLTTWVPNSSPGAAPAAPRTREPEEPLAPAVAAYSPSNALFAPDPEEHPMFDPVVYSWLDGSSAGGEEYTDAPALPPPAPAPVDGHGVSGPQFLVAATGLDGDDLAVARSVRPSRVAAAGGGGGLEMVNTSVLGQSAQGAAAAATATEAGELRFLRAIRISQQHNIVRPGSANHTHMAAIPLESAQVAASTDADGLVMAIQHTQSSLEAAADPDGGGGSDKARGGGAAEKDGSCDCNCDSSFECNICLERAKQPVVTSCGHLFCWPCLYRWLHAQSPFCDCPVCKGEVVLANITPIYGRGGEDEGDSDSTAAAAVLDLPPRPRANRRESLRQQLQMATDARGIAAVLRQMIQNQGIGTSVPAGGRQRAGARARRSRSAVLNAGNAAASESSNPIQLPHSNGGNAEQVVHAAPQQPSAVVVGEPGTSRRSRHSESAAIRRTRRRPQQ